MSSEKADCEGNRKLVALWLLLDIKDIYTF
jgi:hypothetical protein